jgi:hypothetical protein
MGILYGAYCFAGKEKVSSRLSIAMAVLLGLG